LASKGIDMSALRAAIAALAVFVCQHPSVAQEWGKVSKEVLQMASIPEDPEADAVVLFDKGTVVISLRGQLTTKRHKRIKILTESGLEHADVSITAWHENEVKKVKGHTILPGGKKVKLKKKSIYKKEIRERVRKVNEYVFAFPAACPGAVVEYSYEIHSGDLTFLSPWQFQDRIHTKLSELTVVIPDGYRYRAFCTGFSAAIGIPEPTRTVFPVAAPEVGSILMGQFTWLLEDLPAVREEPFVACVKDHLGSIYFQIESFQCPTDPIAREVVIIKTWDDLAKIVREGYASALASNGTLKGLARDLGSEPESEAATAKSIYAYVRDKIDTTPTEGTSFAVRNPRAVVDDRTGTSVEKNILLMNLLRHAGIEAYPVLISTRDNGRIQEQWPQLEQFNHVVARIVVDGVAYDLDAKSRFCPFGVLPADDLSGKGLVVEADAGRLAELCAPERDNIQSVRTRAQLAEDGSLDCETQFAFQGYAAVTERARLSTKANEKYVESVLQSRFSQVAIDTFELLCQEDVDEPLTVKVRYAVPSYAQLAGGLAYVAPALLHQLDTNPFPREDREFPVEFDYPEEYREELHLVPPAGYTLLEAPESVFIPSRGIRFRCATREDGGEIVYQRTLSRTRLTYSPQDYPQLRNAYARIVSADQGQIVLSRKEGPDGVGR